MLVGPGEGAGVIDVGDGLAVAIRIESHNHPSAVEPYQGAATGVGGIIRDIFSMGARPIALDGPAALRPARRRRARATSFEGVVAGISGYGNAVGVPTVGGEVVFDDCYRDNPLVNVLCLGPAAASSGWCWPRPRASATSRCCSARPPGATASAAPACSRRPGSRRARGEAPVGAGGRPATRRSGSSRPCLELLDAGLAVGVQDLGAAGISCAASETAAKTGAGMDVDLARMPEARAGHERRRGDDVGEPGADARDRHARRTSTRCSSCASGGRSARRSSGASPTPRASACTTGCSTRWACPARTRRAARRRPAGVSSDAQPVADVPVESLGDGPVYDRPRTLARRPRRRRRPTTPRRCSRSRFPDGTDLSGELLALLATPTIADKSWVYRQYDHQLFLNTVVGARRRRRGAPAEGHRAAPSPSPPTARHASARSTRAPARASSCSRRRATSRASARVPMALVNCLNFGNPEHPEVMWQFSEVVDGMSEACRALGIPVVGGNVSFYNESRGRDIDPTPVVGVVGAHRRPRRGPPAAGAARRRRASCCSVTPRPSSAGPSGRRRPRPARRHAARAPTSSGARAARLRARARGRDAVVDGVHDCSDGGLAVALAEMAIAGGCGFDVSIGGALAVLLGVGVACGFVPSTPPSTMCCHEPRGRRSRRRRRRSRW